MRERERDFKLGGERRGGGDWVSRWGEEVAGRRKKGKKEKKRI